MQENITNQGTTRRSLLKAAAWAAPVVAVAIAAPGASASEGAAAFIEFETPVLLGDGEIPHGTVYDAANNPLAGVQITFQIVDPDDEVAIFTGGTPVGVAVTNASGVFFVPIESTLASGTAELTLQANVGSVQSIVQVAVSPD